MESLWFAYSTAGGRVTKGSTDASGVQVAKYAFGYDNQSNLSSVSQYDGAGVALVKTICLKHDALGRLSLAGEGATSNGGPDVLGCTRESDVTGTSTRFGYDAFGRRSARRDGTNAWRYFVHDSAGRLLAEATRTGTTWVFTREYVWLDDTPLAQFEGGATYYYHLDGTGQPLALTNASRQTVWSATREPWGNVAESGTGVVTNLRLPGQYDEKLLASVGLQGPYYNWHRWYLPSAGRYLEPDPIAIRGGFNAEFGPVWYGYADQNPLRWIDPEGQSKYDKLFGFPRKFWRWLHKHPQYKKQAGDPDFSKDDARPLYEEWLEKGKPGPGEGLWEWFLPYPDLFVDPCLISPEVCGKKRRSGCDIT